MSQHTQYNSAIVRILSITRMFSLVGMRLLAQVCMWPHLAIAKYLTPTLPYLFR